MGIVMDSRTLEEPKPDADKNIAIQILNLINSVEGHNEMIRLRAGLYGYGSVKKRLADVYWEYFTDARKKRAELAANLDYVNSVLADGAIKARTLAQTVLKRARKNCGLE